MEEDMHNIFCTKQFSLTVSLTFTEFGTDIVCVIDGQTSQRQPIFNIMLIQLGYADVL